MPLFAPVEPLSPHYSRLWAYLQLLRPPNVVTALADVLAGFAAAGATLTLGGWSAPTELSALGSLLVATAGLYGGGVVLNDVFDAPVDAEERAERPIPSGRVSRRGASVLGGLLLIGGVTAAAQVGLASAGLAASIGGAAVLYDARAKEHFLFGPLTMGLCRGGNLMLGVSAAPEMLASNVYLVVIPVTYIAAITAVSRGEVHGGSHRTGWLAVVLVSGVVGSLLALGLRSDYRLWYAFAFVVLFAGRTLPPFVRAASTPEPGPISEAVEAGVLALIPLNAGIAAGFGGWMYGLVVLLLLPASHAFSRLFAVT